MNYQNEFIPNYASPPGDSLLETLDALGMAQSDLALRMGRTKKYVNDLIKGKASISPEVAIYLERILKVPAEYWLSRESQYQESKARIGEMGAFSEGDAWISQFPVKEMIDNGWIEKKDSKSDLFQSVLEYFGIGSSKVWGEFWGNLKVCFRKSEKFSLSDGMLAAWLRKGEIDASKIQCQKYSSIKFKESLLEIRSITDSEPSTFVPKLREICAQAGVAVVFTKEFKKFPVSGATRWLAPDKALIQLSLRYKTNDHLWFTFFHEAGHIILHGKRDIFLDVDQNDEEVMERQANDFAKNVLIKQSDYSKFLTSWNRSSKGIVEFAKQIGIAPGIIVGRLQYDKEAPYKNHNDLKQRLKWID